MTDDKSAARTEADETTEAAEAERKLGRNLSLGIPAATVVGAIGVAFVASAGPAILVLLAGALLGAIAFLWASLRTLGGDAPLSEEMELLHVRGGGGEALAARKQKALRALKDIKHEHDIGKIDDADYAALEATYRAEAKDVLRKLDTEIEPYRAKAEAVAQKHLAKRGLASADAGDSDDVGESDAPKKTDATSKKSRKKAAAAAASASEDAADSAPAKATVASRKACPKCETPNDTDAAFCKKCGTSLASEAAKAETGDDEGTEESRA